MWNARLDEAQDGIKISWRSINNLRYAGDTTLIAESKEELKSPLMKVKEESEKVGLKFRFRKGRGTRDQIANIHWIIKKAREFQENIYFCFIDYVQYIQFQNAHI